jgi:hypothetical protein
MGRGCREDHQRGVVASAVWHRTKPSVWVVIGCCRVRQKDDPVVAKHRVPCCCVAAILGGRPRDDDGIDFPLAQDNVQVRAKKAAVAMLLDDMLTGCRRQLRVDVYPSDAILPMITLASKGHAAVVEQKNPSHFFCQGAHSFAIGIDKK